MVGSHHNVQKTIELGFETLFEADLIVNLFEGYYSAEEAGACFPGAPGSDSLPFCVPVYFVVCLRRELSARVNSPPHITSEVVPMIVSQSQPESGTVWKTFPPQVTMMN